MNSPWSATNNGPRKDEWFSPGRFALILALSIFSAYPEVLLGLDTFYYRDFGFFGYPLAHYHRESFWHGEIPLWNPLNNCGLPFLAQWNTLVLYPGSLFYLLFPLSWSLAVFCLFHQFLAGMGMFCLASRWTGNRLAAAVAGVSYAFNGLTLNCLMWPNNITALGWMPWVILVAQRAWTGGGRDVAAAVAVAAMQMLSGAPEIILFTWLALVVLAAGELVQDVRAAGKVLWRFAGVAFLAVATCAAQLFPFLDLLSHAHRDASYGDSAWAMPIWGWANLLVPMFHCFHGFHGVYWQRDQYWTSSYYPGAAIVALAVLAVLLVRKRNAQLMTFIAVLALILALGDAGLLFGWLRHAIPRFGFMRYPVKFLVLLSFALPLLAAYAVSHLQNSAPGSHPSHEDDLTAATSEHRTLNRRPWVIATIVWLLLLGTMMVVIWYARWHPASNENWTLTWKNGLCRALFLTLTLGAFYLYARFFTNPTLPAPQNGEARQAGLPPPRRRTSPTSPMECSPRLEGLGVVGSASQRPTTDRGILLQQPMRVVGGLALILLFVSDLLTHVPRQNPVVSRTVFEPGLLRLSPQPRHGDGRAMISPANNLKLYRFATTNAFNDYINNRRLLFANCNLLDAIPKVNGFYSLYLRDGDAVRAFLYDSTNTPPAPLCDFLGVSHITDPENFLEWKYRPDYLALANVGQKPVFADEKTTFKAITGQDFDPRSTVYLPLEASSFPSAVVSHEPIPDPSPPPSRRSGAMARRDGGEANFDSASARRRPSSGGAEGTPIELSPRRDDLMSPSAPTKGGEGRGEEDYWPNSEPPLPVRASRGEGEYGSFPAAVLNSMAVGTGGGFGAEQVQSEHERPTQAIPAPRSKLEAKIVAAAFSAHRGVLQITAPEPSWLVIAQNNYHCWRATSDGDPLHLWQANYAFQAALVPEGKHLVQLVYRDWWFAAGTALSVLALIGCLAAAGFRVRRDI